jgi:sugar phosphate isomerase/epimerase
MRVTFACQPLQLRQGLDLNSADASQRRRAVEAIVDCLDQANELGATGLALMSGKNVPASEQLAALERLIQSLREVCQAARDRAGLPVILEIFDYDIDKKALVGTCSAAAKVARAIRLDFRDFGLLHDLSHIYLCHEEPARHLPLIREHLVHVHLGNSVRDPAHPLFGDSHPHFGLAGGDNDVSQVRDFLQVLFDIGYFRPGRRPVVGFEVRPPAGVSSQTVLANIKRTWHQAWWTL